MFATLLAEALGGLPGVSAVLSLSRRADILAGPTPPRCDIPVQTYGGALTFVVRVVTFPWMIARLIQRVRAHHPDLAVCAQPGPLDLAMAAALRWLGVKFVVIVHDADEHPGDGYPLLMWLQARLCRSANGVAALSSHVASRLRQLGLAGTGAPKLIQLSHPPYDFGVPPPQPHDGPLRVLFFGRLLPYKGIDLLADALACLGSRVDVAVRVVGAGPGSGVLDRLARLPGVSVENRWVPDAEISTLLGWADALVLPYREASQSGVAAAALAAGRSVIATKVGGLVEQLGDAPRTIFCDPTPESLAAALERFLSEPYDPSGAPDPVVAWQAMATSLVEQSGSLIPHAVSREMRRFEPRAEHRL